MGKASSSRAGTSPAPARAAGMRTLCIDVGGTGLKALVLDAKGVERTDRVRVETPHPATPRAVLDALDALVKPLGTYDRVSVGFPGVVVDGVVQTAPNLDPKWQGFPLAQTLEKSTGRPVRALNDAGVHGYGVVEGKGTEMLLTFGTGMGCALFLNGHYVPNIELGHHPLRKGKTYEDRVREAELVRIGKKRWNKRVGEVVSVVLRVFNPRVLYLGGGNAKHLKIALPPSVKIVANLAGLLGGIALWHDPERAAAG